MYYFTNSKDSDNIKEWDPGASSIADMSSATDYHPNALLRFGARLCLYGIYNSSSSSDELLRVRWSVAQDSSDWSGEGSGFADLHHVLAGGDEIIGAEQVGNKVIVFGEESIGVQAYTEIPAMPFKFETLTSREGLLGPDAVAKLSENELIFMGNDGIYTVSGKGLNKIGQPIKDELYSRMDVNYSARSFVVYDPVDNRVRLFYPTLGTTTPNEFFEYNVAEKSWSRGSRTYVNAGRFRKDSEDKWDTARWAATSWDECPWNWNQAKLGADVTVIGYGTADGNVIREDGSLKHLDGSAFTGRWDTKDFTVGDDYAVASGEWYSLNFEGTGDSVDVLYSTDGGRTYTSLGTVGLAGADWKAEELEFEVVSERIRFRFSNSNKSGTFAIRWLEVGYLPHTRRH